MSRTSKQKIVWGKSFRSLPSLAKISSVASFWYGGGGGTTETPKCTEKSCTCALWTRASALETYIISSLKILVTSTCTYNQYSSLLIFIAWRYKQQYMNKIPTKHQHWENLCICERAQRVSIENVCMFTFTKWYFFKYFVGNNHWYILRILCR